MATFTIELRRLLAPPYPGVGLADYPIFDESYREHLNKAITDFYKFREIGFETAELFIDRLNQRMRLIMPTYNKLYLSTLHEYDPTLSVNVTTVSNTRLNDTTSGESSGATTSNNNSSVNGKSRAVNSDFPQAMLSATQDYATTAADSVSESLTTASATDESHGSNSGERNSLSDSESTTSGHQSPIASLIMAYRETLVNVDLLVINELADLFMTVWNNGDEYGNYPNHQFSPIRRYGPFGSIY